MKIEITDQPHPAEIAFISESLFQYNCAQVGINDYKDAVLLLKDDAGAIVGGLVGWTRWNWAHIDNLWIQAEHRGKGFGLQYVL